MDKQEGISTNKPPVFDRTHYAFWSIRMTSFPLSQGFDIWQTIADGYIEPSSPPIDTAGRNLLENNEKEKTSIL